MKTKQILEILNTISPFELQESWDNCGLNVDNIEFDEDKIFLSLDVDSELIEKLPDNALLITHHPLIFKPIKAFSLNSFPTNIIAKMVKKNISHIAMHTNFDKTHLNNYVCKEILGFNNKTQEGEYIKSFDVNMSFELLLNHLKVKLGNENIKYVQTADYIKSASLVTGSGASMLGEVTSNCLITGDVKYHDAMLAKELDISIIDIGHYESERYFGETLLRELKLQKISAIIINSDNPFKF